MKNPRNMFHYTLAKLGAYKLKEILLLEVESYLGWLVRGLPSFLGYLSRYLLYKALFKELKSFCYIQPGVYFSHSFRIKCGRGLVVNSNSYFHGLGGIEIGDNVLIGPNVVISSGRHGHQGKKPVVWQKITPQKIVIGNGVWLGANVVVMPGVTIAEGTVVGAGAVVTKSTQPFTIVAGVPAKKIGQR